MSTWLVALMLIPLLQAEPAQAQVQAPAGKADAGKAFWQGQMCNFCHGTDGEGGWGPDLAGRALTLAQFKRAIREPWGLMPAYTDSQVSDQSIADLHAYLTGLPRVEDADLCRDPFRSRPDGRSPSGVWWFNRVLGEAWSATESDPARLSRSSKTRQRRPREDHAAASAHAGAVGSRQEMRSAPLVRA